MSQQGFIAIYAVPDVTLELDYVFTQIMDLLSVDGAYLLTDYIGPSNEWARFQQSVHDIHDQVEIIESDNVTIYENLSRQQLSRWRFSNQSHVSIDLIANNISSAAHDALAQIPFDIRGDFMPASVWLGLGPHDIFECAEHENGKLFSRTICSLRLRGIGCANDWTAYRSHAIQHPFIKQLIQKVDPIFGKTNTAIYWDI